MADDYTDDEVREAFQQGAGILPPFYDKGYEYELQKRGDAFDRWLDESRVGLVPPDNPHRKEQENKPDLRQCGSWWHFSSSPR